MKYKNIKNIKTPIIFSLLMLALGLIGAFHITTASAQQCTAGTELGALTKSDISVKKAGDYKVWVRIQADQTYTNAIGVELTPGGDNKTCYTLKNTSTNKFSWVSTPKTSIPKDGNKIRIVGLNLGVKIDKILLLDTESQCVPSNTRDTQSDPVVEPGNNCIANDDVSEPEPSNDTLPAEFAFNKSYANWEPQGNTVISHNANEGNSDNGSLEITVNQKGPYPDSTRTARAGTLQYNRGLSITEGSDINASFYVKAKSTSRNVRCEVRFYNGNKIIDTVKGELKLATASWDKRQCKAKAPQNSTNVALRVFVSDASYGDVFFVDDAQISLSSSDPTPEPEPETPTPAPEANFTISDTTPTTGQEVTFNASSSKNAVSYVWDDAVGTVGQYPLGEGKVIKFTFKNPGTKEVRLIVTNEDGQTDTKVIPIEVRNATSSPEPKDTQPPSQPSGLKTSLTFDWRRLSYVYKLNWNASSDNVGVKNYSIKRNGKDLGTTNTNSYTDISPVQSGSNYRYEVAAYDAAGNKSKTAAKDTEVSCYLIWCWGN